MARIRSIKPEYYTDERLAEVSRDARFIFPGLWQQADSAGRLEDRPRFLKLQILPYDDDVTVATFDALMDELAMIGAIIRYEVGGRKYIQIPNFLRHQRLTGKEASTLSTIPGNTGETPGKQQGNTQNVPGAQERKGKERKGKDIVSNFTKDTHASQTAEPGADTLAAAATLSPSFSASQKGKPDGMKRAAEHLNGTGRRKKPEPATDDDLDRIKREQIAALKRGAA